MLTDLASSCNDWGPLVDISEIQITGTSVASTDSSPPKEFLIE